MNSLSTLMIPELEEKDDIIMDIPPPPPLLVFTDDDILDDVEMSLPPPPPKQTVRSKQYELLKSAWQERVKLGDGYIYEASFYDHEGNRWWTYKKTRISNDIDGLTNVMKSGIFNSKLRKGKHYAPYVHPFAVKVRENGITKQNYKTKVLTRYVDFDKYFRGYQLPNCLWSNDKKNLFSTRKSKGRSLKTKTFFCELCHSPMMTYKMWLNHQKTKKHKKTVENKNKLQEYNNIFK